MDKFKYQKWLDLLNYSSWSLLSIQPLTPDLKGTHKGALHKTWNDHGTRVQNQIQYSNACLLFNKAQEEVDK